MVGAGRLEGGRLGATGRGTGGSFRQCYLPTRQPQFKEKYEKLAYEPVRARPRCNSIRHRSALEAKRSNFLISFMLGFVVV